jgi:hypothetical protein
MDLKPTYGRRRLTMYREVSVSILHGIETIAKVAQPRNDVAKDAVSTIP